MSYRVRPALVFAFLSLLLVVLMGFALQRTFSRQIEERILESAERTAVLSARLGIQPLLDPSGMRSGLTPAQKERLDHSVAESNGDGLVRVKIWNTDGMVVYSDRAELVGRVFPPEGELAEALGGEAVAEVLSPESAEDADVGSFGRLLEVYVPVTFAGQREPSGAFEIYLDYEPIAEAIRADRQRMHILLFIGLGLLWFSLFPIVWTVSRRLERQVSVNRHQARHDPLTGLPNRSFFAEEIARMLSMARSLGSRVGIVLMDLDRFKEINDTLGHEAGDRLLCDVGERLRRHVRSTDTIARLGGDEFAILLPGAENPKDARAVALKIHAALDEPFVVDDISVEVEASMGVVVAEAGDDVATMLRRADVAMYIAKEAGTSVEVYVPEHDNYSRRRLELLGDLRGGIARDELVLHYQPQVDVGIGRVVAVEALVRWQHPERGLLGPGQFLPLAEQTGLIKPLTRWVVDEALGQCARWRARGIELDMSVNLSMRLLQDQDLPEEIARLLGSHGIPAEWLVLEVTESSLMANPTTTREIVSRLHLLGTRISIDDFGTGYSSLAYLKDLHVDEIKVDRSFVSHMNEDGNDRAIVRSTIDLAHNLGVRVVAEGVEDAATVRSLEALDCDVLQGFHVGRPVPADELADWYVSCAGGFEALRVSSG